MTLVVVLLALLAAFAGGHLAAKRGWPRVRAALPPPAAAETPRPEPSPEASAPRSPESGTSVVRFDVGVPRGTRSAALAEHAAEWRIAMSDVGAKLRAHEVAAVVFAHGTFVGDDPLSALAVVERALPGKRALARELRKKTRTYVDRVLGDFGNFGPTYVRLFEQAIGGGTPCSSFTWSSENHHVGRLEGALSLVRVLATHADLAPANARLLVVGHSHAGQVFALVTQLLSRSLAAEAVLDVARARSLDLGALDVDLRALERVRLDFVTLGAPARYAWAKLPSVRVLHIAHGAKARGLTGEDWIRRLGSAPTDFPALARSERALNVALDAPLGRGFAPAEVVRALGPSAPLPSHGELVLVDYGEGRLSTLVTSGLGHGVYTRLDAMLFHASLVASRLYA